MKRLKQHSGKAIVLWRSLSLAQSLIDAELIDRLVVCPVVLALLVVLDLLTPAERLAFVLHDMFVVPFEEIGPIIGRSAEAARQLASGARRRVRGGGAPPIWFGSARSSRRYMG